MIKIIKNLSSLKLIIIAIAICVITFFIEHHFPTIFVISRLLVFIILFYVIIKFLNKKF